MKIITSIILSILLVSHASGAVLVGFGQSTSSEDWDFQYTVDHGSGTNYAATAGGASSLAGTWSGTTATSSQNHTSGGTYSVDVAGANDQIYFPITTGDIFNQQEYMIEIWVYLPGTLTGDAALFEISVDGTLDGNNSIFADVESNGTVYFRHEGNNVVTSIQTTGTVTLGGWNGIRFRGSVANNTIGVKINSSSWENDADADAVTNSTTTFNRVTIGEGNASSYNDHIYLDDVTIYASYSASWDGE